MPGELRRFLCFGRYAHAQLSGLRGNEVFHLQHVWLMGRRRFLWLGCASLVVGAAFALLIAKPWHGRRTACRQMPRALTTGLSALGTAPTESAEAPLPPPRLALDPRPGPQQPAVVQTVVDQTGVSQSTTAPANSAFSPSRTITTADLPRIRRLLERMRRHQTDSTTGATSP